MQERGISGLELSPDDALLNLILGFSDTQITEAAKNNDIRQFISLCKQKGLIHNFQSSDLSRVQEMFQSIEDDPNAEFFISPGFYGLAIVCLVVFVWGITITHAMGLNAFFARYAAAYDIARINTSKFDGGATDPLEDTLHFINPDEIDDIPGMLWDSLSEDPLTGLGEGQEFENIRKHITIEQINDYIAILQEEIPEEFEKANIDPDTLKQLMLSYATDHE